MTQHTQYLQVIFLGIAAIRSVMFSILSRSVSQENGRPQYSR
jgi:hypothetical protein